MTTFRQIKKNRRTVSGTAGLVIALAVVMMTIGVFSDDGPTVLQAIATVAAIAVPAVFALISLDRRPSLLLGAVMAALIAGVLVLEFLPAWLVVAIVWGMIARARPRPVPEPDEQPAQRYADRTTPGDLQMGLQSRILRRCAQVGFQPGTVRALLLVLLLTCLSVSACSGLDGQTSELEAAQQRWVSNRPDQYAMTFRVRCGLCYWQTEETTVNVDSNQVSDAQGAVRPEDVTVDVLFDALEQNIGEHPDRFEVTFDPEFGYPVSIDIDVDRSTEDDDWTFELLDLTPTSAALPSLPAGSLETGVPYGYRFQIHCGMRYLEDIDGRDWETDQPPYDGFGPFPDVLRQAFENPNESISPVVLGTIELVSDNILEFRARNSDLVVPYEPTTTNIPVCA